MPTVTIYVNKEVYINLMEDAEKNHKGKVSTVVQEALKSRWGKDE